jgi:hypothetical protein
VRLRASDRTSGVGTVQFARSTRRPTKPRRYRSKLFVSAPLPRFVRVRDRAGNWSAWRRIAAARK